MCNCSAIFATILGFCTKEEMMLYISTSRGLYSSTIEEVSPTTQLLTVKLVSMDLRIIWELFQTLLPLCFLPSNTCVPPGHTQLRITSELSFNSGRHHPNSTNKLRQNRSWPSQWQVGKAACILNARVTVSGNQLLFCARSSQSTYRVMALHRPPGPSVTRAHEDLRQRPC